jgi:hypothetical protein
MRDVANGRRGAATFGMLAVALMLGACSSVSSMLDTSSADNPPASGAAAPAKSGLLSGIGIGAPASPSATGAAAEHKPEDYNCPEVTVRSGAGTLLLGSKSQIGEVNAMDLRYQGSLVRFARDCTPRGGVMSRKVGIEGRIITGPAGGPGQVEVPLRIAVVQEGPDPKTVVSKLVRIPVTVGADSSTVDFTHVDQEIAFPMPKPISNLESYVVYVGFDPSAVAPQKPVARGRKR